MINENCDLIIHSSKLSLLESFLAGCFPTKPKSSSCGACLACLGSGLGPQLDQGDQVFLSQLLGLNPPPWVLVPRPTGMPPEANAGSIVF